MFSTLEWWFAMTGWPAYFSEEHTQIWCQQNSRTHSQLSLFCLSHPFDLTWDKDCTWPCFLILALCAWLSHKPGIFVVKAVGIQATSISKPLFQADDNRSKLECLWHQGWVVNWSLVLRLKQSYTHVIMAYILHVGSIRYTCSKILPSWVPLVVHGS